MIAVFNIDTCNFLIGKEGDRFPAVAEGMGDKEARCGQFHAQEDIGSDTSLCGGSNTNNYVLIYSHKSLVGSILFTW